MFKNYQRGKRQYVSDVAFNKGMQFTSGLVDDGYMKMLVNYDISENGGTLIPRPGIRLSDLVLPYLSESTLLEDEAFHDADKVYIVDVKEDYENHRLICVLGAEYKSSFGNSNTFLRFAYFSINHHETINEEVSLTHYELSESIQVNSLYDIYAEHTAHGMPVEEGGFRCIETPGVFAFGNKYYFKDWNSLLYIDYNKETSDYCSVKKVVPKEVDPSEAVNYGYNMLLAENAYVFKNTPLLGTLQFTGILPYSTKESNELLMTPRANEDILFRCYFKGETEKQYKFTWEWRHVGEDDWMALQSLEMSPVYTITDLGNDEIGLNSSGISNNYLETVFKAPSKNILVRVQAYPVVDGKVSDTVEKAMTVGFDFTIESYGEVVNVSPEVYFLNECRGIESWHNRLVLYDSVNNGNIMFISEPNDPSYFPYPNNISIYDESIICVKAYMDSLLVFTSSQIHQVTLNEDAVSWSSKVVQSGLSIRKEDRHLIQVVKNMVYFKSGNYYFMIVPKAQSLTGELVLAPITTGINAFFDRFEHNITVLIKETYGYEGYLALIDYYNYLNYEDVHNVYVLKTDNDNYLNVDLIYSTSHRTWRVYTYESVGLLRPIQKDTTQRSDLVTIGKLSDTFSNHYVTQVASPIIGELAAAYNTTNRLIAESVRFRFSWFDNKDVYVNLKHPMYKNGECLLIFSFDYEENGTYYFTGETFTMKAERINGSIDFHKITIEQELGETYVTPQGTIRLRPGSTMYLQLRSNTQMISPEVYCKPYERVLYGYREEFDIGTEYYPSGSRDKGVYLFKKYYTFHEEYTISDSTLYYVPNTDEEFAPFIIGPPEAFGFDFTDNPTYSSIKTLVMFREEPEDTPVFQNVEYDPDKVCTKYPILGIQLYKNDLNNVSDKAFPLDARVNYGNEGYDISMLDSVLKYGTSLDYNNWQFLDTGFRRDNFSRNKRYREVQFQLNNIDGENLDFGLEFQIDGQPRLSYYSYDIEHVVDYSDPNYGLIYVQQNVDMNLPITYIRTPGETTLGPDANSWTLNQSMFPELSFWKVRASVSGKGTAPRMRLISRNPHKYELLSLNWVYRVMNVR